jgi:hypothetical protein
MLGVNPSGLLKRLLRLYPVLVRVGLRSLIHRVLIPTKYLTDVRTLDHADASVHRAQAARPSRGLTVPS